MNLLITIINYYCFVYQVLLDVNLEFQLFISLKWLQGYDGFYLSLHLELQKLVDEDHALLEQVAKAHFVFLELELK